MHYKNTPENTNARGFLLLVVMGLLTLLLVLCIGFLVMVRSQTVAASNVRNRTDLNNLAYSGLNWAEAQIAARIFDPNTDRVDTSKYVTSTYSGYANALPWYKDLAKDVTTFAGTNSWLWCVGNGAPQIPAKRETKWVYLPADYIPGGGLRARFAIQIVDTNAYLPINDALEDAMPTQAQQAHILQATFGWRDGESSRASQYNPTKSGASVISGTLSVNYTPAKNLFRYDEMWDLASHTDQNVGNSQAWYPSFGTDIVGSDPRQVRVRSPHRISLNTTFLQEDGVETCLSHTRNTSSGTNYCPVLSCLSYTDPDTGRVPLNINTCSYSGEQVVGQYGTSVPPSRDVEGVFNAGALRRIIKVGSFYVNGNTNAWTVVKDTANNPIIKYLDPYQYYTHLPDPANPGSFLPSPFEFDATTHRVVLEDPVTHVVIPRDPTTGEPTIQGGIARRNASATPSVLAGAIDPMTIGTLDPATDAITLYPGRAATADCPPRDPSTLNTLDPATVTIDPNPSVPAKGMSYVTTPDPNNAIASAATAALLAAKIAAAADATAAAAASAAAPSDAALAAAATAAATAATAAATAYTTAYAAAYAASVADGRTGRPYTYMSYDDLYARLSTEEKYQVEKLKTKLALQYQETLCRYFVASYMSQGNLGYMAFDSTTVSIVPSGQAFNGKNYYNTYVTGLAGGKGKLSTTEANLVQNYAGKGIASNLPYSAPRFPVSVDQFRTNVKADLTAMTVNNNNIPLYTYTGLKDEITLLDGTIKRGGEYVNFDAAGNPEICPGKLDRRMASAVFDNICPGKRILFPSETNIEIRDPIGQLNKQRVGIDETAINWIEPSIFWTPKTGKNRAGATITEVATVTPAPPAAPVQGGVNNLRMNDPFDRFLYKEDRNENGILDICTEDQNGNGTLDGGEDTNGNNIKDWWEDVNANGVLDYGEDLNKNTVIDFVAYEDLNANGTMDLFLPAPATNTTLIDNLRERGQEVRTADFANPIKGRDYLSMQGGVPIQNLTTGVISTDRFIDENIYFNTIQNPINPATTAFDQDKPNCLMHPLPTDVSNAAVWAKVTSRETANPDRLYVKDSNGYLLRAVQGVTPDYNANGTFDTIEYIPNADYVYDPALGSLNFNSDQDINGDGKINTYYRTPDRQLIFNSDCFSREITTTSISYRIVVTAQLCDAASVARNPVAPIIVSHSEINVAVQLAADIEGSEAKENVSDYVKLNAAGSATADKAHDPGLRYYRNNLPTIRKTKTYEPLTAAAPGEIRTYCVDLYDPNMGLKVTYDPIKEARGLQIRGGILYENYCLDGRPFLPSLQCEYLSEDKNTSYGVPGAGEDKNGNGALDRDRTSAPAQWVDPLGVPEGPVANPNLYRNLYYKDTAGAHSQNKRRFVIRDLINVGAGY